MIKAIFWDNDGVLVDTEKLYYRVNKQVFAELGIDLTPELYKEHFLINGTGAWHLIDSLTKKQVESLRDRRNNLYSELIEKEMLLLNGVKEILSRLHKKYTMGIVTSSRRDHFDMIHRSTNILQYFDFVLTAEDFTKFKPDPQPYLLALERTGLSKEECIIVEDSERGLASACAAGIKCFVIPHELSINSDFSRAYKVLKNLEEIINELDNYSEE